MGTGLGSWVDEMIDEWRTKVTWGSPCGCERRSVQIQQIRTDFQMFLPRIIFILPWVPGARDLVVDVPDEGDELRAGLDHELELRPLPLEVLVLTPGTGRGVPPPPSLYLPSPVGLYLIRIIRIF